MEKIIYTQDDYETISRNIGKVINQVENNIKVHRQLIDVLSAQDAKVYEEHVEKLENVDKEISEYLTEIKLFHEHLDAFIEEAEDELEPNSMICPVEIDIPVVKKNIMELIASVDENLSSTNLETTYHFSNWERKTENELNNSFLDALIHYKNEREQKMYEEQFRSNQRIMNNAMDDLMDDLSFMDEFEELEGYIEKITSFQDIFEIHKSNFNSLDLQKKIGSEFQSVNSSVEIKGINDNISPEELEILEEFGNKYNIKEIKREEEVYVYQEEINNIKDIAPAVMYTFVGKDGQVHQMYYVQSDSGQNINDINLTVSIPNGVIVEKKERSKEVTLNGTHEFISYKNYDKYKNEYGGKLEELGINSEKDLQKISKYNATGYGATNLAKMSIDMIRYEYPEYKDLTNNQVINKVFIGDPNAFFSKSQIKATIRSYYTMPAYINEIEKHAEMYNLGIGESESQIADISAFDPNWQTIIWEAIGTCESLFGIYV